MSQTNQVSERALMAKVTWRLIPFMFILYIINYLDRVNVGFAKLQMQGALHFSEAVFGTGMGIFFLGYFLLEIPSNLIMERVGARVWIARIMITWGAIAAAMMFVRTVPGFYGLRFALGLAEAGFFPGMILYLTYWFPLAERARAVGRFMTAAALANVIGGPVSGALLTLHGRGGLQGWQWLFLLEGLPACLVGLIVFWYLPNGPQDAKWLTPEERDYILVRLAPEQASASHKHDRLGQALLSPRVWLLCAIYFCTATGSYGFTFWLPSIIKATFHVSNQKVGLVSALPYVAAAIGLVLVGFSSDRTGERRKHMAGAAAWGMAWLALAAALLQGLLPVPKEQAGVLAMVALTLAPMGTFGLLGPFWALPNSVLAGTAAAGGIALINSVGNLGGYVGGAAIGWIKERNPGYGPGLLFVAGAYLLLAVLVMWVRVPAEEEAVSAMPEAAPEPV
jgi:ACS family tartrate transporter-like MFS transporter